jgi:hypothetical protein
MDEDILPIKEVKEWTESDLEKAIQDLVRESNTNFESLTKNLENNPDLYSVVYQLLIEGEYFDYNIHNPSIQLGLMYGIFSNGRGIRVQNKIYEELIYRYMVSKARSQVLLAAHNTSKLFYLPDNQLNMELVLTKFQAFMREQYSKKDRDFLERNGRLVFLAFVKPILNGAGYDFKEPQISEERRLDVVLTYYEHKYIAELKIWRGQEAHEEGLLQLADYLDRQGLTEGYLLIFDHSSVKTWQTDRVVVKGKNIFMVWV